MSEIRRKTPRWRFLLGVAIAFALVYAGFELGRMSAGYSIASSLIERIDLRGRNRKLATENESLEQRAVTAEVAQRVDRQAQTDAQRMMSELQAETARQQQELQFYRGLAVRQFGSGTLRVQQLSIRPEDEDRRYRVLLTLVQASTRDTLTSGTVSLTVWGNFKGKKYAEDANDVLKLEDIEPDKRRELPFSLRFFQQIEVPIELPLDFLPTQLHVEYRLGKNAEPTRQSFNWRVEGVTETPVL